MSGSDWSNMSMEELFRAEAEGQCQTLSDDLLALEKASEIAPLLEELMRAAHSLKGAARIVGLDAAVKVAHVMEDCFVRAQKLNLPPDGAATDQLLKGVDLLRQIGGITPGTPSADQLDEFVQDCQAIRFEQSARADPPSSPSPDPVSAAPVEKTGRGGRRDLRVDAERLDSLVALAGQAAVASRTEEGYFSAAQAALRRVEAALAEAVRTDDAARRRSLIGEATGVVAQAQSTLIHSAETFDTRGRRLARYCDRLYEETLACRMRPFGDIAPGLRRLARDLARQLGKQVRVEIEGEDTEVDRDLLDRLDGPLSHLIRNALDHGLETPEEREKTYKEPEGCLHISARHQSGWFVVTVADDGRGLDRESITGAILRRGLAVPEHVAQMTDAETMEFLLLPGFSLSENVTEISGRGVGLDAVRVMAYGAGGSLRLSRREMGGFQVEVILPVSLSLVRALIVEVAGDFFALPLTRVDRVLEVAPEDIHAASGRQHFFLDGERIEILSAAQVLELEETAASTTHAAVAILQGPGSRLGLVFDRMVGQGELSLQRLDSRLGHVQDVSAVATLQSGEPVVVLDVNDLVISATNFSSGTRYRPLAEDQRPDARAALRILVADDSLTVRELERKLLAGHGYEVDTAVDGLDAWNALREGSYDLLVTDIDMPRMDGIELSKLVRSHARLRDLPIVVVSYKDREEDRARGLEAGADYYLPKSSYQDESLIKAVQELIGEPLAV
ncbi:Wsp signal transduction system sensor histidine kinase WspE [soil metagenome]